MKRVYRLIKKESRKRNIQPDKTRERVAKATNERAVPFDKRNKSNKQKRKVKNKSRTHDDANGHQHCNASSSNNQSDSGGNKRKKEEGSNQGVEPRTSTREQK